MRWRIILNPAAGRGRGRQQQARLEELLTKHAPPDAGWWISETKASGDAAKLAQAARESGFDGVAAAGGDGTLGEVLNGLCAGNVTSPLSLVKLAVLPMGTGNDFARCLGFGPNLDAAVQAMLVGKAQTVDVGRVRNGKNQRYFINIAGCGFDAAVAERINTGYRNLRGTPAYIAAVLQTLRSYKPVPIRLTADGRKHEVRAMMCAVANATSYGGGMLVAPNARLDDGLFDICIIGDATRGEFLSAFPRVFKGTHITHPKVTMLRAKKVRIESASPLPVLADGEIIGTTEVEFEIVPGAIQIMTPQPPSTGQ